VNDLIIIFSLIYSNLDHLHDTLNKLFFPYLLYKSNEMALDIDVSIINHRIMNNYKTNYKKL
jgi:hypothetical protein